MSKVFILSDGSKNSHGFAIDMEKLRLDRFKANPVMLYNHNELVGRWEGLELKDSKLSGTAIFMDDEAETLALQVAKRVENNFIKGASLGIHIITWTDRDDDIPLVEAEVMECSVVDIPSNQNALALYDSSGEKLEGKAFELAINKFSNTKNTTMKLDAKTYQVLGLDATASQTDIDAAVAKLSSDKQALETKLSTIADAEIDAILNTGEKEGRFTPDKRERYKKLLKADLELGKETIEGLPKKKTLAGKEEVTSKETEDRSAWTFEKWRKEDTVGLLSIKKDDPDKYAEILKS